MSDSNTARAFPTGDVLGTITGILLGKIDGIYEVSQFMCGEPVWTHQLPRICREIQPAVLRQHPHLAVAIDESREVNEDNWKGVLASWVDRFGDTISLIPMTLDDHVSIDPISEAAEMIHPDRIIVMSS